MTSFGDCDRCGTIGELEMHSGYMLCEDCIIEDDRYHEEPDYDCEYPE